MHKGNSITYGRLGILTLETNESVFEAKVKITKIFKTIFYSSSSTFTKEEQTFLDGCEFKIYLIGGNGSSSVETFRGLEGFLQHIKKREFNRDEPGAPIFCTFNHVKDHSPVSENFKDSYYRTSIHTYQYYHARRSTQNNRGNITTTETVDTLIMKNAGYQTSMLVVWTSYLGYVDSDGKRPMQTTSQMDTYWFTPASGSGYRYSPSVESVKEYRLGESNDYVIVNTSSINQDNCPMSRRN